MKDFEVEFDRFLSTLSAGSQDAAKAVREASQYAVLNPGKRLRPRILLEVAELVGLPRESALPSAFGVEIFHAFTLVHDDLPSMDDDDERRGKPSTHKAYGEAVALLAGDALSLLSVEAILRTPPSVPEACVRSALSFFLRCAGACGVIGGQALEFSSVGAPSREELERVHRMKTGALFEASFLIPLLLLGKSEQDAESVEMLSLARAFGSAFQVLDDVADEGRKEKYSILNYVSAEVAKKEALAGFHQAASPLKARHGARLESLLKLLNQALGT